MARRLDRSRPAAEPGHASADRGPRLVVDNPAGGERGGAGRASRARAGLPPEYARLVEVHGAAVLRATGLTRPRPGLAVDAGTVDGGTADGGTADGGAVDGTSVAPPRSGGDTWWWDWAEQE